MNPDFLESPRDFFQSEQALLLFLFLLTRQGNSFKVRAFEIGEEFIGCLPRGSTFFLVWVNLWLCTNSLEQMYTQVHKLVEKDAISCGRFLCLRLQVCFQTAARAPWTRGFECELVGARKSLAGTIRPPGQRTGRSDLWSGAGTSACC